MPPYLGGHLKPGALSTGHRASPPEDFRGCHPAKGLSRARLQLRCDRLEVSGAVPRPIGGLLTSRRRSAVALLGRAPCQNWKYTNGYHSGFLARKCSRIASRSSGLYGSGVESVSSSNRRQRLLSYKFAATRIPRRFASRSIARSAWWSARLIAGAPTAAAMSWSWSVARFFQVSAAILMGPSDGRMWHVNAERYCAAVRVPAHRRARASPRHPVRCRAIDASRRAVLSTRWWGRARE